MVRAHREHISIKSPDSDGAEDLVVDQELGWSSPFCCSCVRLSENILSPFFSFGESRIEQSNFTPNEAVVAGHGTITTKPVGVEPKRANLGTFQAVRVDTRLECSFTTGLHDDYYILGNKSEWYACGYGLIHSTASSTVTKNRLHSQTKTSELMLASFTPTSTNESHVRYILVDLQLGDVADYYRANITDEETAEALRRWDAGIRVVNIGEFERKIVNGRWQIVNAGTENTVTGIDVIVTSRSRP